MRAKNNNTSIKSVMIYIEKPVLALFDYHASTQKLSRNALINLLIKEFNASMSPAVPPLPELKPAPLPELKPAPLPVLRPINPDDLPR